MTAQQDMASVIGDMNQRQENDFSKIQARFKTRVKLTSADVEEVIRKRLLEKNGTGETALQAIYAVESANFKTLFDFVDGAKTYRNYTDEAHFVGTYPFVSYQFPLFQAAIEGISDHNVFEGRNSSVGERSMLGVVQQVAKDIGDVEVGTLATFDHMFAGIRASLKSAAQRSIDVAERNLDNQLAIRLLKALFLVKYVDSFQATPRNLTVLVYDRFGLDLPARVGARASAAGRSALCLGPDEWVLHAPEAEAAAIRDAFAAIAAEASHSLVDISDREIALGLEGPAVLDLLACGCPRDLARLPVGAGTRTVFDSAQVVLTREAEDRFRLEVWRSFAPHVRALLTTATAELAAGL